jgi:hypothetical protein
MFKEERKESKFSWENLGNVDIGRPNLGLLTDVRVYRLMQFTLRDVLIKNYGVQATNKIIAEAGYIAGIHFCRNLLNKKTDINGFLENLRKVLLDLNMGILRDETVCDYDEGFIAGILKEYSGEEYSVKEIDCWSSGDRVCRFEIKPIE